MLSICNECFVSVDDNYLYLHGKWHEKQEKEIEELKKSLDGIGRTAASAEYTASMFRPLK